MLLIVGALLAFAVFAIIVRARVSERANDAYLGRMSDQWLSEYRASHPT